MDEVLRLVQADVVGSGSSVQLELAPGLPKVRSDRVQLQQILLHLLVNAVDAMKEFAGERVLNVRTNSIAGGGAAERFAAQLRERSLQNPQSGPPTKVLMEK